MDLTNFSQSRGQIILLIAIVISTSIIAGAAIQIAETNTNEELPKVSGDTQPNTVQIVTDYQRMAQSTMAAESLYTADVENNLEQNEELLQKQYQTDGKTIEVSNIETYGGGLTKNDVGSIPTPMNSNNPILGGVEFSENEDELSNSRTGAFNLNISDETGEREYLEIYIYSEAPEEITVETRSGEGEEIKSFVVENRPTNIIDIGVGTVNGQNIVDGEFSGTTEIIQIQNTNNIDDAKGLFIQSGGTDTTYKTEYRITVETPDGKLEHNHEAYAGPLRQQ